MIIPEHSPLEIQHIRKKFAKDLAEREFFKGTRYEAMRAPEGSMGNRTMSGIHTAAAYTMDDLKEGIQACLKLLAKSEIAKAKSVDRQREVDEGMKLAKRVDALRETAVQEEASLEKYRSQTIGRIQEEVVAEAAKRDALRDEVRVLAERREGLLVPLTAEWDKIAAEKSEILESKAVLIGMQSGLKQLDEDVSYRQEEVAKREKAASYTHDDARERLAKADTLKVEAERMHREADAVLQETRNTAQTILVQAELREVEVTKREKALAIREDEYMQKQNTYLSDVVRLEDREKTLARNIKRYGTSISGPK